MNEQIQPERIPLSKKEFLQPLEIESIKSYWSHNGSFNIDLYEAILIVKSKN